MPSNIPGSVVINGGDFLSMVSKGRYKSPVHRVLSPELENRMSYVYFYYPNFHTPFDLACSVKDNKKEGNCVFQGQRDEQGISAGQYNTLVSEDALWTGSSEERDASVAKDHNELVFGNFIINKWKGVFRA